MNELNPRLGEILLSWEWHYEVILGLIVIGVLYARGWWSIRRRGRLQLAAGWRLVLFMSGLITLGLAILSPIQVLTFHLLSAHMVQHLMFTFLAPVLLLSGNPLPVLLEGLPAGARRQLERWLREGTPLQRFLWRVTSPGVSWILLTGMLLAWHDPGLYDAALRYELLHPVEHLSFLSAALLFWWHVTGTSPHVQRWPRGARLAYMVITTVPTIGAGFFIAATAQPLYSHYTTVPRLWSFSAVRDQQLGGMIMVMTGGLMFLLGLLIFVAQMLQPEGDRPLLSETEWARETPLQTSG